MQGYEARICRLCLKLRKNDFEVVQELTQEAFGEIFSCLLLEFDSVTNNKQIACESCISKLNKCFTFKVECLSTEDRIISFPKVNDEKLDLRKIYLSQITNGDANDFLNNCLVCRLCMNLVKCGKNLKTEAGDMMVLLEKYFPEVDQNTTKEFMICTPCDESLQHYFTFMESCSRVQNRTAEYCKVESPLQIELEDILHFTPATSNPIKEQGEEEEDTYVEVKIEDIKIGKQELSDEGEYSIKDEENDWDRFQDTGLLSPIIKSEMSSSCGKVCTFQTKCKKCLNLTEEEWSETSEFKCDLCLYRSKCKDDLYAHTLTHKVPSTLMYKCDICKYKTKHENNFKKHMLTHDPETESSVDMTVYRCDLCQFQSNYRNNLTRHMRIHRPISELTIYRCHICGFETTQKRYLPTHLLTHKHTPEVIFKCNLCEFQTKQKRSLPTHLRCHRSKAEETSEEMTIKCDICSFQTNRKDTLVQHMLLHKNASDLTIYRCDRCDFQSKHKKNLRQHMLTHKSISDVRMYRCHMCKFESKYNRCLTRHISRHFKQRKRRTRKSDGHV